MTDLEINQAIATQVLKWTPVEGIVYQNSEGAYCYLADYCNSVSHALDLAKSFDIGLAPVSEGWQATQITNSQKVGVDLIAGKAICLCLLAIASNQPVTIADQQDQQV
jgi:hypothetical protein